MDEYQLAQLLLDHLSTTAARQLARSYGGDPSEALGYVFLHLRTKAREDRVRNANRFVSSFARHYHRNYWNGEKKRQLWQEMETDQC